MPTGRVVRFDSARGYGFIAPDNGDEDLFLHVNDLRIPESYLRTGLAVEFDVEDGGRGQRAANITLAAGATAPTGSPSPADAPPSPRFTAAQRVTSPAATAQDAEEPMADVLSADEHTREVTELLLGVGDLTARQIVEIREALLRRAKGHGWIDG